MQLQIPSPLHSLHLSGKWETLVKRDDLIHPLVSGNKYRKLIGHLQGASVQNVVTFGGSFSNHIHATAAYCYHKKLDCEIYVRGKDADPENPTLQDVRRWNARLHFVNRATYRKVKSGTKTSIEKGTVVVPEGGWGEKGFVGLRNLVEELEEQCASKFNHLVLPVGSGTTLAGLAKDIHRPIKITGIRVVRDDSLDQRLAPHIKNTEAIVELIKGYEWGGFAKYDDRLLNYIDVVQKAYSLPLDFIYNAKAFYALEDLLQKGYFDKEEQIIYLHTGGLQGNRGLDYRRGNYIDS